MTPTPTPELMATLFGPPLTTLQNGIQVLVCSMIVGISFFMGYVVATNMAIKKVREATRNL
jgi:hypothetical protein